MSIGMLNHHDKRTVLDIVAKTWLSHNQTKSEEEKDAFVDSMLQNVKIFMLAGHDTTTAAICYAFELLAYHPGEPEKLRAEHGSTGGWSIHRDPKYWQRANDFIPERWLAPKGDSLYPVKNAWRPFEHGQMNCIGQGFALLVIKIALIMVVREFDIEIAWVEWDEAS
ncbi:cytochrome P450, putative [Talaromyces marneffei ATCC 18224]|uniref:Cytochrome P450, putative n=1 Tax=Talaromyces marneffei (strain ATCC 18224 / CBS 334.59 / QM 7333) TaxID=441960 RepID=B6QJK8_TALMQ|nr:cytochrome P450, putative [Talaromyces marneffei ATCC 18224]